MPLQRFITFSVICSSLWWDPLLLKWYLRTYHLKETGFILNRLNYIYVGAMMKFPTCVTRLSRNVIAGIGDPNSWCHCHPSHRCEGHFCSPPIESLWYGGKKSVSLCMRRKWETWEVRDFVIPSFCLPGNSNGEVGEKILKPQHKKSQISPQPPNR